MVSRVRFCSPFQGPVPKAAVERRERKAQTIRQPTRDARRGTEKGSDPS